MNDLIKNIHELKEFVNRFVNNDKVKQLSGSKFYCCTLYTKKNHDEEETRLVKRHISVFDNDIDDFINRFLKETIKLDEMSNYIKDKDDIDYIKTRNLAIYFQVNPALPSRILCNHLTTLNGFMRSYMTNDWNQKMSSDLKKFISGNGKANSVMQQSTEEIFYDYDIDFPELDKREWYHEKLITFFNQLFDSEDYTLISTRNGAHILFDRDLECQGGITPGNKNFNKRLSDLYRSILPDGEDEYVNLKSIVPKLLKKYLEIPEVLKEGQKKFEFTPANDGCPLVGCLSKDYVTYIIH